MSSFWYMASPYSKYPMGMDAAFHDACRCAGHFIARGISVYSPIAHTHPIAGVYGINPAAHDIWLPIDEAMMDAAVGLIVAKLPGWAQSSGVWFERERFEAAGKPIVFYVPLWIEKVEADATLARHPEITADVEAIRALRGEEAGTFISPVSTAGQAYPGFGPIAQQPQEIVANQ